MSSKSNDKKKDQLSATGLLATGEYIGSIDQRTNINQNDELWNANSTTSYYTHEHPCTITHSITPPPSSALVSNETSRHFDMENELNLGNDDDDDDDANDDTNPIVVTRSGLLPPSPPPQKPATRCPSSMIPTCSKATTATSTQQATAYKTANHDNHHHHRSGSTLTQSSRRGSSQLDDLLNEMGMHQSNKSKANSDSSNNNNNNNNINNNSSSNSIDDDDDDDLESEMDEELKRITEANRHIEPTAESTSSDSSKTHENSHTNHNNNNNNNNNHSHSHNHDHDHNHTHTHNHNHNSHHSHNHNHNVSHSRNHGSDYSSDHLSTLTADSLHDPDQLRKLLVFSDASTQNVNKQLNQHKATVSMVYGAGLLGNQIRRRSPASSNTTCSLLTMTEEDQNSSSNSNMDDENNNNNDDVTGRHYLIACDFSHESLHAMEWTMGTMLRDHDTLHIVTVTNREETPDLDKDATMMLEMELDHLLNDVIDEAKKRLSRMMLYDIKLMFYSMMGRVDGVLEHLIQTLPLTMVVCGSRGRGTMKGMLMGSVSTFLVHQSPVPVAVVRPQTKQKKEARHTITAMPLSESVKSGHLHVDELG